jgi:hypothetical protein
LASSWRDGLYANALHVQVWELFKSEGASDYQENSVGFATVGYAVFSSTDCEICKFQRLQLQNEIAAF